MTPKSVGGAAYNKDDDNAQEDTVSFPISSMPARSPSAAATSAAAQEEPPEIAAGPTPTELLFPHSNFRMKALGDVKFSLGVKIQKQPDGTFHLVQQTYLTDVLAKFDMTEFCARPDISAALSSLSRFNGDPGFVFVSAGGAVRWQSKLAPNASLRSCETESMALSMPGQKAGYLRHLQMETLGAAEVPRPIRVLLEGQRVF